jgi:membrane-associated phospholipid phosphatase
MTTLSRRTAAWTAVAGLVVLFALVRWVPAAGRADRSALIGRLDSGTALMTLERWALATISLGTLAVGLLVLAAVTVRRQGLGQAVRIVGAVVGAAVSAELLKRVLPFDATQTVAGSAVAGGSFPSGHSAIAAALALAVLASVGPRLARSLWGPLIAWVTLVAAGTVAAGWHRPSDAVGGVLLAVVWHSVLVRRPAAMTAPEPGAVRHRERRVPVPRGGPAWRWWAVMCAAILVGALVPRAGTGEELGETANRLYLMGLAAVLATTGALLLVGAPRLPERVLATPAPAATRPPRT